MSNLVFDLLYIVTGLSMFLYLLGEGDSYLYYSKRPTKVKWWIHLNHISPQGTKRRAEKETHRRFPVSFAESLRTPFFKNSYGGCFWRWTRRNQTTVHDIPIEPMLSLNDSFWITFGNLSECTCRNIFL